jgi:hypothetical protein
MKGADYAQAYQDEKRKIYQAYDASDYSEGGEKKRLLNPSDERVIKLFGIGNNGFRLIHLVTLAF